MTNNNIEVVGARVHNLKNIDVSIPRDALTVITGLSGSGKSSLAFDTIYAEGQRRYIETFSSYARGMLGAVERPDVDSISGLSPVISIEQKTTNRNPRSTVGTVTEVYDFLRLLYARTATAYSYVSGEEMVKYTREKIVSLIADQYGGRKIYLLAPLVKNRKGHYKELLEHYRKKGYLKVRIDGELRELTFGIKLDRYRNHNVELVVDRMRAGREDLHRLAASVDMALKIGERELLVYDVDADSLRHYSQMLMDPQSGISYPEPAPHNFSFNSPHGACPRCKGLGTVASIDASKLMPDPRKSIRKGGIEPLGKWTDTPIFRQLEALCQLHGVSTDTPIADFSIELVDEIINGSTATLRVSAGVQGLRDSYSTFDGLARYLESLRDDEDGPASLRGWSSQFFTKIACPECEGDRLAKIWRHFRIDGYSISELSRMDLQSLLKWTENLADRVPERHRTVTLEILKEIRSRLRFLVEIGLGYLSLARPTASLSGGESQRIRLATQIGSELVNVLYVLDEPSIGLHQRDNRRLIDSLRHLRDNGNTILVVEHDQEIMQAADYVVDIGPGAGVHGGNVVFSGTPEQMLTSHTLTSSYLNGERSIPVPAKRREGNGKEIVIEGASGHNLKGVNLHLPLGKLVCITGVSGSGKSSLVNGTLYPMLSAKLYRSTQQPLPYKSVEGLDNIDKVVVVDQSPLGRSPRSNPATYTGLFADIRKLFVALPEAKLRGYKPGRFSFNVKGGRCETCKGNGYQSIEMNFLPDVMVPCPDCRGKRYNRETLEVRFKGKSIADILDMTIEAAVDFFAGVPSILTKVKMLNDLGLGYLKLGQPSATLSGGENQRVKLATELCKRDTGRTLYILDEPSTGLHFEDIRILMATLDRLADRGNSVVVIEHNLDIIKRADWIIDMGPDGGGAGGEIVAEGIPEEIAVSYTHTGKYLAEILHGV